MKGTSAALTAAHRTQLERQLGQPVLIGATTDVGRIFEATAMASWKAAKGRRDENLRGFCNEVWLEPGMAVCFPHDFRHEIVMPQQVRCS